MTANRFYVNSQDVNLPYLSLRGSEHHHLYHVLRKKAGEIISLFDEKGTIYKGKITKVEKDKTIIYVLNSQAPSPRKIIIKLGLALLKAKSMDLVIQKATEWGIGQIIPLYTQRSVVKIDHHQEAKLRRWQQIAIEAAKQSGQVYLPKIERPLRLNEFLKSDQSRGKYLLSELGGELLGQVLQKEILNLKNDRIDDEKRRDFLILIGPEGGWTEEEQNYMMNYGFNKVSLGPFILRAETAAISTIAIISHFFLRD